MELKNYDALHIRYTKLYFTLTMAEDTILPKYKGSALRGGIGEMLLRANCVRNRDCENCDFREECLVQRTMYSHFDKKPAFVTTGESIGYVLVCENYDEEFSQGDELQFTLTLFGKTIVYFNQYLQAIAALGMSGLGKYRSKFYLTSIKNERREDILEESSVIMERYRTSFVDEYVKRRLAARKEPVTKLRFYTPFTTKYQGEFLQEFDMNAVLASIRRRIYMLDCFEGIDKDEFAKMILPEITMLKQKAYLESVPRYSSRQDSHMVLKGIKGSCLLEPVPEEALEFLYAGELLHIGKNTSFGFGKYRVG